VRKKDDSDDGDNGDDGDSVVIWMTDEEQKSHLKFVFLGNGRETISMPNVQPRL